MASAFPSVQHYQAVLGEGAPTRITLDQRHAVRYAQRHETTGFFNNLTTVLYLSGLVGDHAGTFRGHGHYPPTGHLSQDYRNGETAAYFRIILVC